MKPVALFLVALTAPLLLAAQPEPYKLHIATATALYAKGDYKAAATEYSAAFETMGWKGYGPDRYNAARAWSLAGNPDSAFFNLNKLVNKLGYDNLDELNAEPAFNSLHPLPEWQNLCARVKANQPSMPALAKELETIGELDQKYRQMLDSVQGNFGWNSKEMDQLRNIMIRTDSANTARVCEILDAKGWLGSKEVGANGNSALFLVIQHADMNIQEKYLPMMREAVKNGMARGADLALLEDRVLMRNGKKQIYGSQLRTDPETGVTYFFPIEDVDHVNERRAAVGLEPLEDYARRFGIVWDAAAIEENRKRELPKAEPK